MKTGKSQIGDAPGSAISTIDWAIIQTVCFEGVKGISSRPETVMTAFGAGSWLFIAVIVIYKIVVSATNEDARFKSRHMKACGLTFDANEKHQVIIWVVVCVVVFTFLAEQFWAFFCLRQFQSDMVKAAGGKFPDGQWTFGQIVAVVVFLPVATEVLFQWNKER